LNRLLGFLLLACAARAADPLVYIGTYTGNGSGQGIYAFRLQTKTGKLAPLGVAAETSNPSFLVEHPNHRFLYAVNENGSARQMGSVSAFAVDSQTGKLTLLNWVSSRGGAPCHLAFDRTGKWLAVANYEGASIAVIPVLDDGKLGNPVSYAATGGHAHGVVFSPDNRFLLAADLGLDRIFLYRFDAAKGLLAIHTPPVALVKPGSGVRHLAFHPGGKVLYALNELTSTVTTFDYDAAAGRLEELQTMTTLPGFSANNKAAELAVNADGTLLYVSNRGHDSIYTFAIDPQKFTLSPAADFPTLGETPRHFAIDPSGQYLFAANEGTNDIAIFKVHARTGQLAPLGKLVKDVPKPACVLFVEPAQ
jgi:6-phosphogluconolactonase